MALTIGTNIASLKAQQKLSKASGELSTVYERLSSGLRINKASDDAAGLAIAESLKSETRILRQGVRNLNDGISLLNIADSALDELTNIVTRIQELATQASNGTYTGTQRKALDLEAQALSKEYTRITQTTQFNGKNLFSSNFGNLNLQISAGQNGFISSGLGGVVGTGTLSTAVTIAAGTDANGIVSADFNNDGINDLAYTGPATYSAFIRLGTGDGSYGTVISYAFSSLNQPYELLSADLNNDGILDLVASGDSAAHILFGTGTGSFGSARTIGLSGQNGELELADMNNDGFIDIVTASLLGSSNVYLGQGDGSFTMSASLGLGTTLAGSVGLDVGDINGDGINDIVASQASGASSISIFLGTGSGSFTNAGSISSLTTFGLSLGDYTGDGVLDLALGAFSLNSVWIYSGNNNGTFTLSNTISSANPGKVENGDLNGDGILDLVVSDSFNNTVSVLIGRGGGSFNSPVTYSVNGSYPVLFSLTDVNDDGVTDVISANVASNSISIFKGNTAQGEGALLSFSLKTISDAKAAQHILTDKLRLLTTHRGTIGAFQSRVEVALELTQAQAENYRAAESRIRDADIAEESANMIRLSILQKAAAAILAQANQQPDLVLKLLN